MHPTPRTDWYIVLSLGGTTEGTREAAAAALEFAAGKIREAGYRGGNYEVDEDEVDIEVHLAGTPDADVEAMAVASAGPAGAAEG